MAKPNRIIKLDGYYQLLWLRLGIRICCIRVLKPRWSLTALKECDLAGLRVAATEDFGFAPTARDVRATFGVKIALFRHLFARCDVATPDCSGSDESFAVLRAISVLAEHGATVRDHPTMCGPNLRANVEEGQRYSAVDVARAMAVQTAIHQRWQTFFANYDVITGSYFHWLALAYAVTVVGHPALSLLGGLDHAGMPFGLQIVGPRGGDAKVLAVAAALNWQAMPEPAGRARTLRRSVGRPP